MQITLIASLTLGGLQQTLGRDPTRPWAAFSAHARALDLTLVTTNLTEFSRVPGLRLENWLG